MSGIMSGVSWNERAYDAFNLARWERVQLMEVICELDEVLALDQPGRGYPGEP